jgi:hypothetical protein
MKIGRNDPCNCGSGKKYKSCCLKEKRDQPTRAISEYEISARIAYKGKIGRDRERWCQEFIKWKEACVEKINTAQRRAASKSEQCISCSKGCNHCCSQHISASLQECEAIVYWLNQNPNHRNSFLKKYPTWREAVRKHQEVYDRMGVTSRRVIENPNDKGALEESYKAGEEYFRLNIACPFLSDGSCSIYPVRPLVCAGHVVVSPTDDCRACSKKAPELLKWSEEIETQPSYFRGAPNQLINSCAPLLVHEILRGGFSYLEKMPTLMGIKSEADTDPEIRAVISETTKGRPL